MKKFLVVLTLTFALSLVSHAVRIADYSGTWTNGTNWSYGTNEAHFSLSLYSDGSCYVFRFVRVDGVYPIREENYGLWTQNKTGLRVWNIQSSTNAYTGTAFNGIVRGTFKSFIGPERGTVSVDLPK